MQRFPSAEEISSQKTIPMTSVTQLLASNMSLFKSINAGSFKPPLSELRKSLTDLKSGLSNISKKLENTPSLKSILDEGSKENRRLCR